MRDRANLTYGQLAVKTGLSAATLRAAAAGTRLPTSRVVCAFASSCGGDQEMALALWAVACRAAGREAPCQPPADPPDPAGTASTADLVGMLTLLRQWADSPSLAELNRRAGGHNLLPPSTVSDMLHSQRLPRLNLVLTFVRACGLDEDQAAAWQAAWEHIKARESNPPPTGQPSGAPAPGPPENWQPALTHKEATKIGISKEEYEQAFLYARKAAEEHQALGTPRDRWETTLSQNARLADPFITDGEQELARRLGTEADPAIDKAQGFIENVKANLDGIAEPIHPITAPETGASYSVAAAVERVEQYDRKIDRDESAGKHHHRRASALARQLASWAPWIEVLGFLTFVAYFLNVPAFQPWLDWLGWSFTATVAVVIILGQTWPVRRAARSHNHAREADADGNRHEAEQGYKRRNWYIGLSAVTAGAVTGGMIWRGIAVVGSSSVGATAVMVFVAAVTGLLMPTLIYLGTAVDGSTASRDRESLAADLDNDLDAYLETINDTRRDLADVAETGDTLTNKTFPDICNTTQDAVDAIYSFYAIVRLLIGGLSAEPPPKITKTIGQDAESNLRGYIGTSIPGTRKVNLEPLFDRWRRLTEIEKQRKCLLDQVEALPPHPWGRSRTD